MQKSELTHIDKLTSGLAHEINTPLTYIKGVVEMMGYTAEDIENDSIRTQLQSDMEMLSSGMRRLELLADSMREMSNTSKEEKQEINIYETLISALKSVNKRLEYVDSVTVNDDEFSVDMLKDKYQHLAYVHYHRIELLWTIIINNALDSLLLETHEDENTYLKIESKVENKSVIVTIKDNGNGIDSDLIDSIFEPFTSTKDYSGIGMGLNIARKIVKENDGEISAVNMNNGVKFTITLPSVIPE